MPLDAFLTASAFFMKWLSFWKNYFVLHVELLFISFYDQKYILFFTKMDTETSTVAIENEFSTQWKVTFTEITDPNAVLENITSQQFYLSLIPEEEEITIKDTIITNGPSILSYSHLIFQN